MPYRFYFSLQIVPFELQSRASTHPSQVLLFQCNL